MTPQDEFLMAMRFAQLNMSAADLKPYQELLEKSLNRITLCIAAMESAEALAEAAKGYPELLPLVEIYEANLRALDKDRR